MNKIVDVLIIGSGVSGIYTSLNLKDDIDVLLISKGKSHDTNTNLAQGGISTARNEEDIKLFIEDTLKAGKYKNDLSAVKILTKESIDNIKNLIKLGVNFDKCDDELIYTREGAHSVNRIVHTKDNTGESVQKALINELKQRKNITVYEDTYFADIISENNKCMGAIIIKDNKQINVYAKCVVLASGGIGGVFKNSTNQKILNGDSIAVSLKNNIKLENLNYIQIHPTAFYEQNSNQKRFLISEAVRGEGGILLNSDNKRFVDELLPRDIVSKAIYEQIKKSKVPYVNLDITFMKKDYIMKRFPFIYEECLKRGIDISKEYIKVSPAQHYFMGGIKVDLYSKTSMENLYAVGETSCTGVHGKNRLASNSLLEGLVFSKRCANNINDFIHNIDIKIIDTNIITTNLQTLINKNREMVINIIKEKCGDYYDELLDCR
ncbi:L-aspartate oxidase [Romboutsia sedimentorum]|uniref:L-aspartate oxidase n=1 Tax=Romboutsia sedimentorum TaxID=1368474 RepID=A0ABT7EAJ3_9FIRM|nr:L-aspartate oxidase [Romboutsia sedimentorum]MDK2563943.1 L-aspartate oxidase [Romboutsia sedimentorum]